MGYFGQAGRGGYAANRRARGHKTRAVSGYDGTRVRSASRRRPRTEWLALKPGAHEGYVDWERVEAIRRMVSVRARLRRAR
jgi:hypothetical protein